MNDKEIDIIQLTIYGLVQGVGFRPYIAELARKLNIKGSVKNVGGLVYIISYENEKVTDKLICRLFMLDGRNKDLPGARVDNIEKKIIKGKKSQITNDFIIEKSHKLENDLRFLPPDIATCERCEKELNNPHNRRYRHPFISCISCGPRFSIIKSLPYDRENITMGKFKLCKECRQEYTMPGNIRRHAQTIACNKCGPKLYSYKLKSQLSDLKENEKVKITNKYEIKEGQAAFSEAVEVLKNDGIVAIKDIGGYHFATSPFSHKANKNLRNLKNREEKPFAVMFPNTMEISKYCKLSSKEISLLESPQRPIVLLDKIENKETKLHELVCMNSNRIGVMLPCNPLQILLMNELGPLVMTSGNLHGEPIIINDNEILKYLKPEKTENETNLGIDLVLGNDREIYNGLDDSICQLIKFENGKEICQTLRRARGFVPEPIIINNEGDREIFAAGGDLKAVFALAKKNAIYLSGHFGDIEDVRAAKARQTAINHMKEMLDIKPEIYISDKHPKYISVGEINADKKIQHHFAHILSVVAEHNLQEKILGIAYDGTGYGDDGNIWGGEFLLCNLSPRNSETETAETKKIKEKPSYKRVSHISPIKVIGGDQIAKNAKMSSMTYAYAGQNEGLLSKEENPYLLEKDYNILKAAISNNINCVYSTSVGRLFDAVTSLIDICHRNEFEGQCPQYLQIKAEEYLRKFANLKNACKHVENIIKEKIKTKEKLEVNIEKKQEVNESLDCLDSLNIYCSILKLKRQGLAQDELAFIFHYLFAKETIKISNLIAEKEKIKKIALSGGSMQNRLLLQLIVPELEKNYDVYLNEKVPAGDGGIALGQAYFGIV